MSHRPNICLSILFSIPFLHNPCQNSDNNIKSAKFLKNLSLPNIKTIGVSLIALVLYNEIIKILKSMTQG